MIQNLFEYASYSDLKSTGIDDFEQYTRKIQCVISILSCTSDYTWAAVRKYSKKDIDNKQTMSTITTETGEICLCYYCSIN